MEHKSIQPGGGQQKKNRFNYMVDSCIAVPLGKGSGTIETGDFVRAS
jgi:hypothetical protein